MQQKEPGTEIFSTLLESVYDATTDPDHWQIFLHRLASVMNGKSGIFRVIDEPTPAVRANVHYNLDPHLQEAHRQYYVTRDVYIRALRDRTGGTIVTGEAILNKRELQRTEFFADYMQPQDSYHVCGGLAMRNEDFTITFGLQRDRKAGPFCDRDVDFIRRFVPHIQRAARFGHLLDVAKHRAQTAEQALESLAVGVVLLDEHEHVLHCNHKADEMIGSGVGLSVVNGRIVATAAADGSSLRDMLALVRSRAALDVAPIPEAILLTPRTGDPQLLLVACPVRPHQPHFRGPWPEISVAVFVSNLNDAGLLNHEILMTLYGLTPAEARLACALSRGRELASLSNEWQVSRETLRSHLKRVLGKTGTTRQVDLVRLLNGKPWGLFSETLVQETPAQA